MRCLEVNTFFHSIEEFCACMAIEDRAVARYMNELNELCIRNADDIKRFRASLRESFRSGRCTVNGVCEWIVDLVRTGIRARGGDAAAQKELLDDLGKVYQETVIDSLRFSAGYVDARVGTLFRKYSQWLMESNSTKIKLIWALLGYSIDDCNLKFFLENRQILTAHLDPLLEATKAARRP
jgi:hypothetical protein